MTITYPPNGAKAQIDGDGVTGSVAVDWTFWDENDLEVIFTGSDGVDATWTYAAAPGSWAFTGGDGGTGMVSFTAADLPTGTRLTVIPKRRLNQPSDLDAGNISQPAIEAAIDRQAAHMQQLDETQRRMFRLPKSTRLDEPQLAPLPEGHFWTADANGNMVDGGSSADIPKGVVWRGAWAVGTTYGTMDAVKRGGTSYVATANHVSAASTEPGVGAGWQTVWDTLAEKGDAGVGESLPSVPQTMLRRNLANDAFEAVPANATGLALLESESGNDAVDLLTYQFAPSGPALSVPQLMRRRYVDVGAYCPLSDASDATAGVTAALAESEGREVVFTNPFGGTRTYVVSSELVLPANSRIIGEPGTTLDFSTAGDNDLMFRSAGTILVTPTVTANVAAGDTVIVVDTTAGLSEDALVFLSDNGIWSSVDSSTEGEWVAIKSIDSATQVTLYWATLRAYTVANAAQLTAYAMIRGLKLSGLTLRGKGGDNGFSNQRAIEITAADGLLIEDIDCDGFNRDNLQLLRSTRWKVASAGFNRSRTAGLAYGIVVARGCAWGLIDNVRGFDMRHVVTIGGTSGINRHIHVRNGFGQSADFDAHPAAQFTTWEHCETVGGSQDGIIDQGAEASFQDCITNGAARHGIHYNPLVTASGIVSKGRLVNCRAYGSQSAGIIAASTRSLDVEVDINGGESEAGTVASVLIQLTGANATLQRFGISGHKASAAGAAHGVRVLMNNATAKCESGSLNGVHVDHAGTGQCLYLQGAGGGVVEDVSVVGCRTNGGSTGLRGIATDYIATSANRFRGAGAAINVDGANNSLGNDITV